MYTSIKYELFELLQIASVRCGQNHRLKPPDVQYLLRDNHSYLLIAGTVTHLNLFEHLADQKHAVGLFGNVPPQRKHYIIFTNPMLSRMAYLSGNITDIPISGHMFPISKQLLVHAASTFLPAYSLNPDLFVVASIIQPLKAVHW